MTGAVRYPNQRATSDPVVMAMRNRGVAFWAERGVRMACDPVPVDVADDLLDGAGGRGAHPSLAGGGDCRVVILGRDVDVLHGLIRRAARPQHDEWVRRDRVRRARRWYAGLCRTVWHELGHVGGVALPVWNGSAWLDTHPTTPGLMSATHPVVPGDCRVMAKRAVPEAATWADRQIATYAVPVPAAPLTVYRDACPGGEGACTDAARRIWLPERDRFALAHEVGHVYLERDLDDYWRDRISRQLGQDPTLWSDLTAEDCFEQACPHELAADAYAACALGLAPEGRLVGRGRQRRVVSDWQSAYGYLPTRRQHRRVCRVIRASGASRARERLTLGSVHRPTGP